MPLRRTPGRRGWQRGARLTASAVCVIVLLGLFLIGLVLGTALGSLPGAQPFVSEGRPAPPHGGGPDAEAPDDRQVTTDRTVLVFSTVYDGCGCVLSESRVAGAEFAGMTCDELSGHFPGWQLQDFGPSEVGFFRLVDGLCPDMQTYRTIGLHNGDVAVFLGRPEVGLLLSRLTGIPASMLSDSDRQRLQAGIVVTGDEAVERHLEGLRD